MDVKVSIPIKGKVAEKTKAGKDLEDQVSIPIKGKVV